MRMLDTSDSLLTEFGWEESRRLYIKECSDRALNKDAAFSAIHGAEDV